MKRNKTTKLLLALLFCSANLMAQTEQLAVPLTNPGKPYTLNVSLLNGSIQVSSYSGTDVVVEVNMASSSDNEESKDTQDGMKRISGRSGYEITANENNNVIFIHNSSFTNTLNLNLKIPQQTVKLKLSTVNDGDIVADKITGELEINNVNGAIKASDISGSVVATTINGDIRINFITLDPDAAMAFSSLSGNIDLSLPQNTNANLKLKSDMGEMYSDFDITIEKSLPKVNRTAQSGMYQLMVEDWVYGKINGGGPEFMIKNMSGNIYIRKAK